MKNSLRMFIRESLMKEAVGRDLFGLQSVDYIDVRKEKFEDAAVKSVMETAGTFFQAGKAFITAPRKGKIRAASSILKSPNWISKATGAAYIFAMLASSFGGRGSRNDSEKDQLADTKIEELHKKLIEIFKSETGASFVNSLRYEPVVKDTAAANFYEESKIKPFRDHYEIKIPGRISASTDYNTFFSQFSNLSSYSSAAANNLDSGVQKAIQEFIEKDNGVLGDKPKLLKALNQWAYYDLVFLTTHEFVSRAMEEDIATILKNTTDDASSNRFKLAVKDMVNAAKSKIENSSTYKKAKSQLNEAGYYEDY